jgi:L-alanine-DL-glutamate epimerase-like enolase superfamily enzyme
VRATRAAVSDDLEIMADLNQWWRMPGDADRYLTVPDAPGLGAVIDHPAVARYARTD